MALAVGYHLVTEKVPVLYMQNFGKASRELFEIREAREEGHDKNFLTVGLMGHAWSIAFGIAL